MLSAKDFIFECADYLADRAIASMLPHRGRPTENDEFSWGPYEGLYEPAPKRKFTVDVDGEQVVAVMNISLSPEYVWVNEPSAMAATKLMLHYKGRGPNFGF